MRILLVSGTYPDLICGVGDYTAHLAAGLARIRDLERVSVLTSVGPGPAEPQAGVEVHRVMEHWGLGEAERFVDVVRLVEPDVVHLQYPSRLGTNDRGAIANAIPLLPRAAVRRGARPAVVTTLHEFSDRSARFRARAWLTLLGSDAVIFTSSFDEQAVATWPRLAELPKRVIPIAPNLVPDGRAVDAPAVRRRRGLTSDALLVVHFGLLAADRGLDVLAEASGWLAKDGIEVVVVGDAAPRTSPESRARRGTGALAAAEASGTLRRVGHLPAAELSALLSAADVAVFPFAEGASPRRGSVLAAMAHSLPVVTTRGPHVPREWDDEDADVPALLVEPGDPAALATSVLRLRDDPALRDRLGAAGRRWALRTSWEEIAARTAELYAEVTVGRGG